MFLGIARKLSMLSWSISEKAFSFGLLYTCLNTSFWSCFLFASWFLMSRMTFPFMDSSPFLSPYLKLLPGKRGDFACQPVCKAGLSPAKILFFLYSPIHFRLRLYTIKPYITFSFSAHRILASLLTATRPAPSLLQLPSTLPGLARRYRSNPEGNAAVETVNDQLRCV